jgi:PAS domain S-box-containing protein
MAPRPTPDNRPDARSTPAPEGGPAWTADWRAAGVTAIVYFAVGWVSLMLAGPPGYASPLYPAAGIALAAGLAWGRVALPGVWLGAFAVNASLGLLRGQEGLALLTLPALIGLGAALQAGLGAALVKRYVGDAVVLNSPRDIALTGALGALLACMVSPSVATPALLLSGTLEPGHWLSNWLTWWVGDALGVLIAAPAVLTLIGQPRADWRPRRLTVGLPLLLALGLAAGAMAELGRLDRARLNAAFERDADRLAAEAQSRLGAPLFALQALHGAFRAQPAADARTLREAARWWLAQPMRLQAMGYSERVAQADIPAFERAASGAGLAGYRVFHRDGGAALAGDGEVLAVRLIEPAAGNVGAVGVNTLSVPAARTAVLATRASGEPAASAGFKLSQSDSDETGLVLYQALYREPAPAAEARQALFRGVVFVTVRADALLAQLATPAKEYLRWCLVDIEPGAVRRRIAGTPGCEDSAPDVDRLHTARRLQLGGRAFALQMDAAPATIPLQQRESAVLLSLAGMAAAATMGALLLVVTGHSRRTELAVQAGTAQLRREMDERAQAQSALLESESRLRNILDHAPIGVMFLDENRRMLECNPRLCRMLGRSAEQLQGRTLDELAHPAEQGLASGADENHPLRLLRSDGSTVWVQLTTTALHETTGAPRRRVGVVQDVTERLRLESSERALQQAESSSRAKSEFVSRMSHELRTPLNAMIGFAQLLGLDREPALLPHQAEWTQQIQRAGWHLLEMINETLDLARIESGHVQLSLKPLALAPLVTAARSMVAAGAAQRQLVWSDTLAPDAAGVMADATRLKQVLTNLFSNAVKYNRDGGTVSVAALRGEGGTIAIHVADSGMGMTPQQLSGLFQPYNRLGRESSTIEGTGIGLVICRRLTELMGGTLEVRSVAGRGSTFTLSLPAADLDDAAETPAIENDNAAYQQRRVHYVEDNETNVEVMRGVLLQRQQIALSVSTNGLDGLEAIRRLRPDLVLLDMHLPDISGLELLRHLKNDDELAEIPVIVVSADATTARMQEALTLGALHYVTKPLDIARFLGVLDQALESLDTRWGM